MRKLFFLAAIFALFLAPPAFANGNGPPAQIKNNDCNGISNCDGDVYNGDTFNGDVDQSTTNEGGTGLGVGIGAAGVFDSGNSEVGNGEGNFSPDATAIQGQLGILDNDVDNTNEQGQDQGQQQGQKQGQEQTSVGSVDSHDSVEVNGDDVVYEAPDIPVNSAAPVFAGACSQGVSVQTSSFGGSAGTTNPVCDYVAVAGGFVAAGERTEAVRVLDKAEDAADWRFFFSQVRSVLTLGLL